MKRTAALLLAVLALTGCSSDSDKASDLKKYLADQWSFSSDYAAVKTADIVYADGNVTVKTTDRIGATQAQEMCGWVSDWLYGQGSSDKSTVRILNPDGDVLSQRRHANDVCSFG